jgi:hypothetical protein
MARVGQLHIAWSGYERTVRLLDHLSDKRLAEKLTAHCRDRQADIESQLPSDERPSLRPAFDADLKAGLDYQSAYQSYESRRLADGASIDDPHFYDAFFARHGDIASPPGRADEVTWEPTDLIDRALPTAVLTGGLAALPTALFIRRRERR